ncbi:MAG: YicC family protein [Clostridiales bacterium]|nr:YicC family protein [Clostridiales bacterium]
MKSMTGFGRSKLDINSREYIVEIKSVNHKYNDISIKIPRIISSYEERIKKIISNFVSRGKVDVFITFNNYSSEGKNIVINKDLAQNYINEMNSLVNDTGIENSINVTEVLKLPDVLQVKIEEDESEVIWNELEQCITQAVINFVNMREIEGERIKQDLFQRINNVENLVNVICKYSTGLIEDYVVKLRERIKEILNVDVIDETRLAQEIVIYADKCSIEEEIIRLKSHIMQFKNLLDTKEPIGKKIDFLIQEMNRETNTIASKSVKLEITNIVIEIKSIMEDIREQIQNIE